MYHCPCTPSYVSICTEFFTEFTACIILLRGTEFLTNYHIIVVNFQGVQFSQIGDLLTLNFCVSNFTDATIVPIYTYAKCLLNVTGLISQLIL